MGPTLGKADFESRAAYRAARKGLHKGEKGEMGGVRKGGEGKLNKIHLRPGESNRRYLRDRQNPFLPRCRRQASVCPAAAPSLPLAHVSSRRSFSPTSFKELVVPLQESASQSAKRDVPRVGPPFDLRGSSCGFSGPQGEKCLKCLKRRDVLPRDGEVQIR